MAPERGPMTPVMYRVTERIEELTDTVTLTLEPVADAIATPEPGQFTMLWAFGIGEAPISLARIGSDDTLIHTIRSVGAVTAALCKLVPGDEVGVRGPYGSSWPVTSAHGEDILIVAGGLGISPVRPIIDQVLADRDNFGRCTVLVGARRPDALIYTDELAEWANDDRLNIELIVDSADEQWAGQVGLITKLIANADLVSPRTHVFLCGPEPMMHFGADGVVDQGVPADQIWLSLERNMHCAVVQCGHCQLGPLFVCREGPVIQWPIIADLIRIPER